MSKEITWKLQKRNDKGEKIEFVIDGGNFEERQIVERGNSEQVLPAQINKLETNGISSEKDPNKQTDNNKTEDIAIENIHNNNKSSNESKTKASIGSKTVEKGESDYKETTLTNETEKEKGTTNKTKKEQLEQTNAAGRWGTDTEGKKKYEKGKHWTSTNIGNNWGEERKH